MEQNGILNAANTHADGAGLLEVGTWIGRHQAFGLISSKSSAADAACLREIRDNKHYRALGLTWEEFCSRHAGVDRKTADRIVERLEEFGEAYFNLSQLDIRLTQLAPIDSGFGWADRTIDSWLLGGVATACCIRRKKSFPRLADLRRLKRKVNSSR
jgi:hypothetical protein